MRALLAGLAGITLLAVAGPVREAEAWGPGQETAGPDSTEVARLLQGLRGSDPLVCALATDIFGTGIHWRSGDEEIAALRDAPASAPAARERYRTPIADGAAVRLLVPELGSPSACIRRTAAALLGESEEAGARAALRNGAGREDARIREAATYGLGVAGDTADVARLRRLLRDSDPGVVRLAAWALGSM